MKETALTRAVRDSRIGSTRLLERYRQAPLGILRAENLTGFTGLTGLQETSTRPTTSVQQRCALIINLQSRCVDSGQLDVVALEIRQTAGPEFNKLIFAHEFWAGWLDAREHDWMFYEPIKQADWHAARPRTLTRGPSWSPARNARKPK